MNTGFLGMFYNCRASLCIALVVRQTDMQTCVPLSCLLLSHQTPSQHHWHIHTPPQSSTDDSIPQWAGLSSSQTQTTTIKQTSSYIDSY